MAIHHNIPRHFAKRQSVGTPAMPTVSGFDTSARPTATGDVSAVSSLAFDPGAGGKDPNSPTLPNGVVTPTPTSLDAPTATPSESAAAASGASRQISVSTVVGSCIGAFVGAVALIIFGLWMYRRYARSLKKVKARGPISSNTRHGHGEGRPRSRSDPWNKLEDGDDMWESKQQTKEVEQLGMEKLTMFKKSSPSVRTEYTHKSDEPPMDSHPFAQYHPGLAKELAASDGVPAMPSPHTFLSRVQTGSPMSWDAAAAAGDGSFLQLRPNRLSGGAMSPTLNMAIPTPPATSMEPHRWESAEVVHIEDGQSVEVSESSPSDDHRQSISNPFFNAQEHSERTRLPPAQQSPTTQSHKGKERAYDIDPFDDGNTPPPPGFVHYPESPTSSVSSNDRAMQSLIAALGVAQDSVQSRLRIASMQPSELSMSAYTSGEEEDDVAHEFPTPPSAAQRR